MGLVRSAFNALTAKYRTSYEERLTDELLFGMPHLKQDPAIILGVTRATPFVVQAAVAQGHKDFVIVGGKLVNREDTVFTKFLKRRLKDAGFPPPSYESMKEHDYARQILNERFGIAWENITSFPEDNSTNTQQNLEMLQAHGFDKAKALEVYTLSGSARRFLSTARKLWGERCVLAVHNAYPQGIDKNNWQDDFASAFFMAAEAEKILSFNGGPADYVRRGFCTEVNIKAEISRVQAYVSLVRPFGLNI